MNSLPASAHPSFGAVVRAPHAFRCIPVFLLLVAGVISARLGWGAWNSAAVAGCVGSGCGEVTGTAHAWVLGLPVGFWGALAYLAAAGALVLGWRRVFLLLAGGIVAAALWFTGLQAWVIGAWCAGCMTVHALALVGVALGWTSTRGAVGGGRHSRLPLTGLAAGLAVLAGVPSLKPASSVTEVASSEVPGVTMVGDRVELFGGEVSFERGDFPLYGDPQADDVAVLMWNPSCHHCRTMQPILREAGERLAAEGLAIVAIPSSGPGVGEEWARLLHVAWQKDPARYPALAAELATPAAETVLLAGPHATRKWFAQRLGEDLENHGPQADLHHAQALSLLESAGRHTGQAVVPLMIRGKGVIAGALLSVDALVSAAKGQQPLPADPSPSSDPPEPAPAPAPESDPPINDPAPGTLEWVKTSLSTADSSADTRAMWVDADDKYLRGRQVCGHGGFLWHQPDGHQHHGALGFHREVQSGGNDPVGPENRHGQFHRTLCRGGISEWRDSRGWLGVGKFLVRRGEFFDPKWKWSKRLIAEVECEWRSGVGAELGFNRY
jgi:uncharacterized membrane protein